MARSEIYEEAETAVFWDVDGCEIPAGGGIVDVSKKTRRVLDDLGYCSEKATIYAFGDEIQIRDRLESSAIIIPFNSREYQGTAHIFEHNSGESPVIMFTHTPAGDKDARLKKLLISLFCWALDNPGPANLMIILEDISAHVEFDYAFHRLTDSGYNVIVAQPRNTPHGQLRGAVETKLSWESLLDGEISTIEWTKEVVPSLSQGVGNWMPTAGVGFIYLVWILYSLSK